MGVTYGGDAVLDVGEHRRRIRRQGADDIDLEVTHVVVGRGLSRLVEHLAEGAPLIHGEDGEGAGVVGDVIEGERHGRRPPGSSDWWRRRVAPRWGMGGQRHAGSGRGHQRGAEGAGLGDVSDPHLAELLALGGEHGGVVRPAAADDHHAMGPRQRVDARRVLAPPQPPCCRPPLRQRLAGLAPAAVPESDSPSNVGTTRRVGGSSRGSLTACSPRTRRASALVAPTRSATRSSVRPVGSPPSTHRWPLTTPQPTDRPG